MGKVLIAGVLGLVMLSGCGVSDNYGSTNNNHKKHNNTVIVVPHVSTSTVHEDTPVEAHPVVEAHVSVAR